MCLKRERDSEKDSNYLNAFFLQTRSYCFALFIIDKVALLKHYLLRIDKVMIIFL